MAATAHGIQGKVRKEGASQVHEHGGNALAAIGWLGIELVVEVIVMGLVLLAVHVVQDLQALPVLHRQVCHLPAGRSELAEDFHQDPQDAIRARLGG